MNYNVISPESTDTLLKTIDDLQGKKFRFGAGYSDLIPELQKTDTSDLTVVNLAQLVDPAFCSISFDNNQLRIGALVTANEIVRNKIISEKFPVLHEAAKSLASDQIRESATVGGNVCTASPSGDIACALVALGAQCKILATNKKIRTIALTDFQLGVRKTDLKSNELLQSIVIKDNPVHAKMQSEFIKIGVRKAMECSIISMAYHILLDSNHKINHAGISIGAVAPTIRFTEDACSCLIGKNPVDLTEKEKETFAEKVLSYANPISDIRATAWYRKEVLYNISKSLFS